MKLSIIIPVYNSSKILKTLLDSIHTHVASLVGESLEVILINDKSLDDSWSEIKRMKIKYNYIKGINLRKNYGQHSAIFCGLKNCSGDKIICMDDDMQHDPKHIPKLINQLDNYDVCYVKYVKREHNYFKILISQINNLVSSFLMSKSIKIYTSSFKCFNKTINNKIIANDDTFVFLDYWIFKYSRKITSIDVTHNKRLFGKTNYGFKELLTLWSKMIFLIEVEKKNFKYFIILIIRFFFRTFLKNYISYRKKISIEIQEII